MVPVLKGLWADLERMKVRLWVADRGDLRVVMLGRTVSRLDQWPQSVQEKLSPLIRVALWLLPFWLFRGWLLRSRDGML